MDARGVFSGYGSNRDAAVQTARIRLPDAREFNERDNVPDDSARRRSESTLRQNPNPATSRPELRSLADPMIQSSQP